MSPDGSEHVASVCAPAAPAVRPRLCLHRCTGVHTSRPSSTAVAAHAGPGRRTSGTSQALTDPCTPHPLSNHVRPSLQTSSKLGLGAGFSPIEPW